MARNTRLLLLLMVLLMVASVMSLCLGASGIDPGEMFHALITSDQSSSAWRILTYVRLPRTIAAIIAGSALAGAGLMLQSVLRNPLAGPSVIGVNAGAGLCALVVMAFFPSLAGLVPAAAFIGAFLAVFSVYILARLTEASRTTLVLSGVAVNSLLGACMDAITTLVPDAALGRSAFSIGGFANVTMAQLKFALPFWLLGLMLPLIFYRELEIMTLGDEVAHSLGVPIEGFRRLFLLAAALLSGAAVSFSGLLGFVGLIVPHLTQAIIRQDQRLKLPLTLIMGSLLCLVCDSLARVVFAPYELPVGILLAFLGAPFFIFLLIKRKRSNRHDSI